MMSVLWSIENRITPHAHTIHNFAVSLHFLKSPVRRQKCLSVFCWEKGIIQIYLILLASAQKAVYSIVSILTDLRTKKLTSGEHTHRHSSKCRFLIPSNSFETLVLDQTQNACFGPIRDPAFTQIDQSGWSVGLVAGCRVRPSLVRLLQVCPD